MSHTIDANTFSLADIIAVLTRRRWLMLSAFILVFSGAAVYALLAPKQYSTHMKVLVKNERAEMIVSPDRNGTSGYREEVTEAQINSEIELLTGNDVLQRVASKSGLDRSQHVSDSSLAVEKAVKRLGKDLKVSPVRKANIILVEYTDTDPRRAVAVLANLADLYLEEHLKVHGTPGTYEFFKVQAVRYKGSLNDAESRLADFRRRERIVMLPQQKEAVLQRATESEQALMQTEASIMDYNRRIEGTRRQLEAAQPRVVTQRRTSSNQFSVERLHTMMAELQNRRTLLLAKFRPDDRMVQEADQEIADTRVALDKATRLTGVDESTDVNPVHQTLAIDLAKQQAELAGLQSRRDELKRQTGTYRQQLSKLGDVTADFDGLVREQKEAEENYLLYAKKAEEARIAQSLDLEKIANVAIAEAPVEPHMPSSPNIMLILVMGGLIAALLSIGLAFAVEYLRNTVEKSRELEEISGLPVLATSYGD